MALKSLVEEKSLKKVYGKKSYHFETLFSGTLFWFQYDFIQKRQKTSYFSIKCMEQRMFTTMQKRGNKNTHGYIQNTFSQDLGLFFFGYFFFRTLFPVILFPETLLAAPILF